MNKILFATNGSASSQRAEEMVKQFLQDWPQVTVVALYVTNRSMYVYDAMVPSNLIEFENGIADRVAQEVAKSFAKWARRVKFQHEVGHPAVTICDVAEREGADLIIIGNRGGLLAEQVHLGSVSHGVVHRAKIPVLVAKDVVHHGDSVM